MNATRPISARPALPTRLPALRGEALRADFCIIDAGGGGHSVAAGTVQMGACVVLVEKHLIGGDGPR